GVGGRDLAGRREEQRQGGVGGAGGVRRRGVDHQHTAFGGGLDIDVVQPDAGAGDDLELGGSCQYLGVDGGGRTDKQRVGLGYRGQQLLPVGTVYPAHLDLVSQGCDGRLSKFVGD